MTESVADYELREGVDVSTDRNAFITARSRLDLWVGIFLNKKTEGFAPGHAPEAQYRGMAEEIARTPAGFAVSRMRSKLRIKSDEPRM